MLILAAIQLVHSMLNWFFGLFPSAGPALDSSWLGLLNSAAGILLALDSYFPVNELFDCMVIYSGIYGLLWVWNAFTRNPVGKFLGLR